MSLDDRAAALDATDPLAGFRDRFRLPENVIYLDGNSLGVQPRHVAERVRRTVEHEWAEGLIGSWNAADWIELPRTVGDRIAALVGAAPGSVTVGDSTSVNLFKCLAAAIMQRPGRRVIVTEETNFPTDGYMMQGLAALRPDLEIRAAAPGSDPAALVDADTAVVALTHVDYRTAALHDMDAVTAAAHAAGAMMVWDLSHSTGALPVDLAGCDADFAVGCTYKYLNGGPGAPAFAYVAPRLGAVRQPLSGWMGHRDPFAFAGAYEPAEGAAGFLCGSPQILSLAAVDAALALWDHVDMAAVRAKSVSLTGLFMEAVEAECGGHGLTIVSPRDDARRGSHVSIAFDGGYAMIQALIGRGVVGDFRAPDLMRFGFAPLYVSHLETLTAVRTLRDLLETGTWRAAGIPSGPVT